MKYLILATLMSAPLAHAGFWNESTPGVPLIPNGADATMEQMVEAQAAVNSFVDSRETYLRRITPPNPFYNHVVEEVKTVAETYNEELREFFQVREGLAAQ